MEDTFPWASCEETKRIQPVPARGLENDIVLVTVISGQDGKDVSPVIGSNHAHQDHNLIDGPKICRRHDYVSKTDGGEILRKRTRVPSIILRIEDLEDAAGQRQNVQTAMSVVSS